MDVSSVSGSNSIYSVDLTQAKQPSTSVDSADPAPADVSKMGSLMSQLDQLSKSDPTKFKEVTSDIADKLSAEATSAGGKATFLSKLASDFTQASQSGDMSAFKPPEGAQGSQGKQGASGAHHHHHAHASGAYSPSAQQQSQTGESVSDVIQTALQDATATSS